MAYTFLLTLAFIALAFVALAIRIIVQKGGKFPNSHISGSKALKEKNISCALSTDAKERGQKDLAAHLREL